MVLKVERGRGQRDISKRGCQRCQVVEAWRLSLSSLSSLGGAVARGGPSHKHMLSPRGGSCTETKSQKHWHSVGVSQFVSSPRRNLCSAPDVLDRAGRREGEPRSSPFS